MISIADIQVGDKVTWKTRRGWPATGDVEQVDLAKNQLMVSKKVANAGSAWTKNKWYEVSPDKIISVQRKK